MTYLLLMYLSISLCVASVILNGIGVLLSLAKQVDLSEVFLVGARLFYVLGLACLFFGLLTFLVTAVQR